MGRTKRKIWARAVGLARERERSRQLTAEPNHVYAVHENATAVLTELVQALEICLSARDNGDAAHSRTASETHEPHCRKRQRQRTGGWRAAVKAAAEAAKERETEKSNCKGSYGSHVPARKATARLGLSGADTPATLLGTANRDP